MNEPVQEALRIVLADTYALMAQTQICHWNIRGPSFFDLHAAFEKQYVELFAAVDEIAERIRAKGSLAPGGLGTLAALARIDEIAENASAEQMVKHLLIANEKLLEDLRQTHLVAGKEGDLATEDLMIVRTLVHEKTTWLLRSYLGH